MRARLVELDERNVALARQAAQAAGLHGVEVLQADAGITDACAGAVPAEIVVACGIFGNIADSDIQATVAALPSLCAPGALVLWTRHRSPPDLTPAIRSWFGEAGFREEAFDTSHDGFMSVGAHRLTGEPAALALGQRLFTFPGGTKLGPTSQTECGSSETYRWLVVEGARRGGGRRAAAPAPAGRGQLPRRRGPQAALTPRPATERAEIGEQAALRAGADHPPGDLAVLEDRKRWHREDPVPLRGQRVLVHVSLATTRPSLSSAAISSRTGDSMWQGGHHCCPEIDQDRLAQRSRQDEVLERLISDLDDRAARFRCTHGSSSRLSPCGPRVSSSQRGDRRVAEVGEALRKPIADVLQFRDVPLQVRELAAVHLDRLRTAVTRLAPSEQARDEWAHVLSENPIACSDLISRTSRTWSSS